MILLYSWNVYARRSVRRCPQQPRTTLFLDSVLICPFVSDTRHHTFMLNIDFSISGISLPFTCLYERYLCVCKHAQHIHIPLPLRSSSNPQYQKHVLNNMKIHTLPNIQSKESHGCLVVINVRKTLPKTLFNRHVKLLSKTVIFPLRVGLLMQLAFPHTTLK
jgi:hypothetical protein